MRLSLKILDKVWIIEGNVKYPGIIINIIAEAFVVLKFDRAIWRRVVCQANQLEFREENFSQFMFKVRESLINSSVKFSLP